MKYNGKKHVVIIEVEGGSDKADNGHRRDTFPILESIKSKGFTGEVIFYTNEKKDTLKKYLKDKAGIVIGRINPGNLGDVDTYFQFLDEISKYGILVNTHPDVMINLDFKDILVKLKKCSFSDHGSYFFHEYNDFKKKFPETLKKYKKRVLKQNYGSTGEGVWLVSLNDNGSVNCTEAVNNEKYNFESIDNFILDFERYFEKVGDESIYFSGKSGFVDVRYLPRITEGEVRVLLIGEKPSLVVHKKPQEGEFSATLFSGAKYESDSIDDKKWDKVITIVNDNLKEIKKYLGGHEFPLVWTLDFILDYNKDNSDEYILSEVNCSCVGITTDMHLKDNIADEVIKMFNK